VSERIAEYDDRIEALAQASYPQVSNTLRLIYGAPTVTHR